MGEISCFAESYERSDHRVCLVLVDDMNVVRAVVVHNPFVVGERGLTIASDIPVTKDVTTSDVDGEGARRSLDGD
jgi:hypothetical protein